MFLRMAALIIGVLAVLVGMLWVGQGTGTFLWPSNSFMLSDRKWAVNGAVLAAVGLVVIWLARFRVRR